ncbi:MAG: hypothetical protein DHS20C02_15700 [Micavibrio sp.]|nr:MAG: hypothetical protein DHS20C02_15700 [Micavibrio sp.]
MKKLFLILVFLPLALTACEGYRTPSLSKDPAKMSSATLCYRYAGARPDQAISDEVLLRNLDCTAILNDDPLYQSGPDLGPAHRMSR